jgi:hypothetical protein
MSDDGMRVASDSHRCAVRLVTTSLEPNRRHTLAKNADEH